MLLSGSKSESSTYDTSISVSVEELLENVKPNLISTSTESCSSNLQSEIRSLNNHKLQDNTENVEEKFVDIRESEASFDSFTVILEEPELYIQNAHSVSENDIFLKDEQLGFFAQKNHSATTPDLLENCSKACTGRGSMLQPLGDIRRRWSSVNDLPKSSFCSLKANSDCLYPAPQTCNSSTTVSSVHRSKDSGFPRSLSCLSLSSGVKPYDHVQSKVKEYIREIKRAESERKKNAKAQCESEECVDNVVNAIPHEQNESLHEIVKTLKQELSDKDNMISQIQENYDSLLMKYAEAENRIDRLRFKVIDSSVEEIRSCEQQDDFNFWHNVHTKEPFINRSLNNMKIGHREDNSPLFKSIFPSCLTSHGGSVSMAENLLLYEKIRKYEKSDDDDTRHIKNGKSFLSPMKHSAIAPLAFSTPNNSFSECVLPSSGSVGAKGIPSRPVTFCPGSSNSVSRNISTLHQGFESIPSASEKETQNFVKSVPAGIQDYVESGDKDTIDNICRISSGSSSVLSVKSSTPAKLGATGGQESDIPEQLILKVKEWQDSLPSMKLVKPNNFKTTVTELDSYQDETTLRNSHFMETEWPAVCEEHISCSASNENHSLYFNQVHKINREQPTSNNKVQNRSLPLHFLLTNKSFSNSPVTGDILNNARPYSKSEPDLRRCFSQTFIAGIEPKKNVKSSRIRTEEGRSCCRFKNSCSGFCTVNNIRPLVIEPCDCWKKHSAPVNSCNPVENHCNNHFEKERNGALEETVPCLKLGDLVDGSDDLTDRETLAYHHKDITSHTYSPSTSMSSTEIYSAHRSSTKVQHLINSDTSTSYKNIQRRKRPDVKDKCHISNELQRHVCVQNSLNKIPACCQSVVCICNSDNGWHSSRTAREHLCKRLKSGSCRTAVSFQPMKDACCHGRGHGVAVHSCGVNTDSDEEGSSAGSKKIHHKFSPSKSTHTCGVNTDAVKFITPGKSRVEILSNESVLYQKQVNKHNPNKYVGFNSSYIHTKNNDCIYANSPQGSRFTNRISVNSNGATSATAEKDSINLTHCLEEVNHIATLLKAQSENIIEVVSMKLKNEVSNGNIVQSS